MIMRGRLTSALAITLAILAGTASTGPAVACGGFFCQNSPVNQNAEHIIFTQNEGGTI